MDLLENFLSGTDTAKPTPPTANNPGNLRPSGASTGFQQFATPEEGIAAADKNLQAYGKKGINTLRGVINRWAPPSENDTNAYVDTIAKKIGLNPDQLIDLNDPVQRHVISGAMFTVEKGSKNLFKSPQATQPADDFLESFLSGQEAPVKLPSIGAGAGRGSYAGYSPEEAATAQKKPEKLSIGSLANKYLQTKRELGERVAGAADVAYGVVPAGYGAVMQALARTANTPERAAEIGRIAQESISQPFGKALGITGKETYQKPLGGVTEPIAEQIGKLAKDYGLTPDQLSQRFGIPVEDVRNMLTSLGFAVPQAVKEVAGGAKQVAGVVAKPLKEARAELEIVPTKPKLTPEEAKAQFEAKVTPGSAGAAAAQGNPYFGKFTGEEVGGSETFPRIKLTKMPKDVPIEEQKLRSQLFQEVLPGVPVRPGVVTGNENLLRNEHGLANMPEPSPLGIKMKEQIANEQIGLSKFAEDRVNATGASRSLINDEQRGERINNVFHGVDPEDMSGSSVMGYLNQAKKSVYDSAFEKNGNNPIKTNHIDNFINDPLERTTFKAAGQEKLLESAKDFIDLARTTGFKMPDGKFLPPGSVSSYDHVKKILNSDKIWNRDKASLIRDINGAIDQDIAAVADPALYKLGDKIHKLEKDLFKSKGIDRIFGEVDKNNVILSATALEKIPQKLNNMPKDQWRHVRDTLNELSQGRIRNAPEGMPPVPKELQEAARSAVAEIDGALAREVYKAGAGNVGEWSSNKANNVLNSVVGQKIVETFPPNEVQKFHALNYVGHYVPPLKYEGAGMQARRVGLLEKGLPAAGATVGGAVGAFLGEETGAAGGAYIGREVGVKLQARKAAKEEKKAVQKMEKEMEKSKKLGQQTGKNNLKDLK